MPTPFYRRDLPHLQRDAKPHFLTFCTHQRWHLPDEARSMALESCLHDHEIELFVHCAVVMPDHVHMIFVPLVDNVKSEIFALATITQAIESASAHRINKMLGRKGSVWQDESFDHVLRSSEALEAKIAYLLDNPVRTGLVRDRKDYPWLWQAPERQLIGPLADPA